MRPPASRATTLVWEDGGITQLVAEAARAWHAGRSSWADETDMNSVSIGIEIVNRGSAGGAPPYPAAQVEAVAALAKDICVRQGIAPHRVLAHSDIAPDRKDDPGEWFPWARLAAAGVGCLRRAGGRPRKFAGCPSATCNASLPPSAMSAPDPGCWMRIRRTSSSHSSATSGRPRSMASPIQRRSPSFKCL